MMSWFGVVSIAAHLIQGPAAPLTLEEAVAIALQNAFSVKAAAANLEKSRQRVNEIRGALGPKINAGGSYTRFDRALTSSSGGSTFTTRNIDDKQAQISLSLPIDIAGVTKKGLNGARKASEAAEWNVAAARNDVVLAVRRAFFNVLQADAQVQVAEETRKRADERRANAQTLFDAGAAAKIDVLRLETALSQADTDLIVARNAQQATRQTFNNVLARPINSPVDLVQVDGMPAPAESDDALTAIALSSRPELNAIHRQIEYLAYVRMAQEGGMTPSLSLSALHSRSFNGANLSNRQSSGTLSLTVPIWDSGITRARVKQARQDEELAQIQLNQTELGVSLEVRQALTSLRNARTRLDVAIQQVKLAEETYRLAQIKFEAGEGIPLEITDAQTELTRARTNEVTARYDYLRAYADLQRAVGTDSLQPKPSEQESK